MHEQHGLSDTELAATATADEYVEITLELHEDSVAVHGVTAAVGDPDLKINLEKKSSFGSSVARNASTRIKQELKRLASLTRHPQPVVKRLDRTKSAAAQALKGLKFITKTESGPAWTGVEKRFNDLTSTTNGMLPRSLFGECIGKSNSQLIIPNSISSVSIYSYYLYM